MSTSTTVVAVSDGLFPTEVALNTLNAYVVGYFVLCAAGKSFTREQQKNGSSKFADLFYFF